MARLALMVRRTRACAFLLLAGFCLPLSSQAADASNVTLVGSWSDGTFMRDVTVENNLAYIAAGSKLTILNCATPSVPVLAGSTETAYNCFFAIALQYPYVYALGNNAGPGETLVADVSNPGAPAWVGGTPAIGGSISDIALRDPCAYICGMATCIQVLSLVDPVHPVEIYRDLSHTYVCYNETREGDYLYLATAYAGMAICDLQDPTQPVQVGATTTTGDSLGVDVEGIYTYLATDEGLSVVDATDVTHPAETAFLPLGITYSLVLDNHTAFMVGANGLHVVDVSTPLHPSEVGYYRYYVPVDPHHRVAVQGGYIYVVNSAGFFIYQYTPAGPTPTATPMATPTTTPVASLTLTSTPVPGDDRFVLAYPNPGRDLVRFRFHLDRAADIQVRIYNMAGEKAAELGGSFPTGSGAFLDWPCQEAAPGVYLACVWANGVMRAQLKIAKE